MHDWVRGRILSYILINNEYEDMNGKTIFCTMKDVCNIHAMLCAVWLQEEYILSYTLINNEDENMNCKIIFCTMKDVCNAQAMLCVVWLEEEYILSYTLINNEDINRRLIFCTLKHLWKRYSILDSKMDSKNLLRLLFNRTIQCYWINRYISWFSTVWWGNIFQK